MRRIRSESLLWLVGLSALVLLAYGWTFLLDPSISAPTRDPAWYTWRANVLMNSRPSLIVEEWGPFSMFSGGYRVSVPLLGALLTRVAGTDLYTFSGMMMVGMPLLTGLALGAFAYQVHRDRLLFLIVVGVTSVLSMTTPYVGYLDNTTILFILSAALAFVPAARTSWGARVALFLLALVGALTHPTTCVIFGAALFAAFCLHLVTSRFRLADALRADAHYLWPIGIGMIVGLALWLVGPWGVPSSLADAALPPPYTQEVFEKRLWGWIDSLRPPITAPLLAVGLAWLVVRARRDRRPVGEFGLLSSMWLLPLAGTLGFLAGLVYPYYRFMNATTAIFALVGLGTWVVVRWLLDRRGASRPVAILALVGLLGAFGYVWVEGRVAAQWATPDNQWIAQPTRTALAATRAIVANEPPVPVVFVVNDEDDYPAYGWSKTFTNVSRTGVPGDAVERTRTWFGAATDLASGTPTPGEDPTYAKMTEAYADELALLRSQVPGDPIVFLVRQFNAGTVNEDLLDAADPSLIPLGPDVAVITGPGFTTPSDASLAAAVAAEDAVAEFYADHPNALGNLGHNLRVLLGLLVLLVLPGLVASRWLGIGGDPWVRFALVPAVSFALTILAGFLVVSVTRSPFGVAHGWATAGLALVMAGGLRTVGPRVEGRFAAAGRFVDRMFSVFSNRSFSALMGTQFLGQIGDGIVQASLAKSIAFGGQSGFDVTSAPSTRYLLLVVLALYVPYTLVSPFVGAFIDRYDRRRLLIRVNLFRGGVVLLSGLALAGLGDGLPDGALIVTILIALACTRAMLAIKSAGVPAVVDGRDLLQANGLSQAGGAISQVLGGGLALVGTLLAPSWSVALLGAVAYVGAGLVARRVDHLEVRAHRTRFSEEIRRVLRDIAGGLREVAARPAAALGLAGFQSLRMEFFGFVALVFALQARSLLAGDGGDQIVVAIAGAAGAVGAAIGMVLAQRLKDRVPPYRIMLAAMLTLGLGVLAFGGVPTITGYAAITFVGALGFFLGKISADTIVQQAMPDDFRGRAFSLFDVAYNLGWIVPALILSLVWSDGRVREILIGSGIVFLGVTALLWRWSRALRGQLAPQDDLTTT